MRVVLPLAALHVACSFPHGTLPSDTPDAQPDGIVDAAQNRVTSDLIGVWTFGDGAGDTVSDSMQVLNPSFGKPPMNLTVSPATNAQWIAGGLRINERLSVTSPISPQAHICRDIIESDALTVELWATPANAIQGSGDYAVLFTLSPSYAYRNLTIAQAGDHFIARVLTTATTSAGLTPELASAPGTATSTPVHVVVVANATQRTLYVNGEPFVSTPSGAGSFSGWKDNFRISMADEMLSDHHWTGTLWFAAAYDRALTQDEVRQNFEAGHDCTEC